MGGRVSQTTRRTLFHAREFFLGLGGRLITNKTDSPMRKCLKDKKKEKLLTELSATKGIISPACKRAGVSRYTFYEWLKSDENFRQRVEEIQEEQGDFVESKLLENIDDSDTQAIIFYAKTKLKHRGYTERDLPQQPAKPQNSTPNTDILQQVNSKFEEIKSLMQELGRYSPALNVQINIAAQLCVKADMMFAQTLLPDHKSINTQISREGNERESISAAETLYRQYAEQCQSALRALGLNTDGKLPEKEDDSFDQFYNDLNSDD